MDYQTSVVVIAIILIIVIVCVVSWSKFKGNSDIPNSLDVNNVEMSKLNSFYYKDGKYVYYAPLTEVFSELMQMKRDDIIDGTICHLFFWTQRVEISNKISISLFGALFDKTNEFAQTNLPIYMNRVNYKDFPLKVDDDHEMNLNYYENIVLKLDISGLTFGTDDDEYDLTDASDSETRVEDIKMMEYGLITFQYFETDGVKIKLLSCFKTDDENKAEEYLLKTYTN